MSSSLLHLFFEFRVLTISSSVEQYLTDAKLSDPIAGTYFTQETGTKASRVSVEATTSVDSTTLPQFTQTSTGSGTGAGTSSSGGASATGGAKSSAASTFGGPGVMSRLFMVVIGLIGGGSLVL
jgi:hypothetical protein